jgi:hypothetical protein
MDDPRSLYLDLLKKCLKNWIYGGHEVKDWARKGFWKRLDNLQQCIETVVRENVPGDLIETGVWRGAPAFSCGRC